MIPKGIPKRIYLQLGPEKPERGDKFADYGDVTWCVDKINAHDVEYIRADVAIQGAWTRAVSQLTKQPA